MEQKIILKQNSHFSHFKPPATEDGLINEFLLIT